MAALVGILPIMMDYMEDIKNVYPNVYNKRIKKAGNEFIAEVNLHSDRLFRKVAGEDDKEVMAFYHQISDFGTAFNQWLTKL
jgi:hypothetical protein